VVGWVALEWSSGVFERVVAEGVFLFLYANLFVVASQDGGMSLHVIFAVREAGCRAHVS
jgi:hypothetical protein